MIAAAIPIAAAMPEARRSTGRPDVARTAPATAANPGVVVAFLSSTAMGPG
jgi:hypothetical protein